jgi:hypothetical protein
MSKQKEEQLPPPKSEHVIVPPAQEEDSLNVEYMMSCMSNCMHGPNSAECASYSSCRQICGVYPRKSGVDQGK